MNELLNFLSVYFGGVILFTFIGLLFKWFFIKSAVKSGTKAAINEILQEAGLMENIQARKNQLIQEEINNEIDGWN